MTMPATAALSNDTPGLSLRIGLWVAQVALAFFFCFAGIMKLITPIPELSAMMPWTGQTSEHFVRFIALVDLAGGLGILLPALTRVLPKLTVLAALGCTVLQILAFGFHMSRGEFALLPLNTLLLALSIFILWGRTKKAPIAPRA